MIIVMLVLITISCVNMSNIYKDKECVFKRLCFNVLQNNDLSVSFDVFLS